ncbi:serine protease inhibitor Cvsi-2-like [Saccostrea cucullata]|uniref:serine protease inhibitor Cvsi-2-like n=1 Tax=Saccostrea cuccullata TaxID=36930 RepID=UPI002ED16B70
MKVVFILALVVVAVSAERCDDTRDCTLTTCTGGSTVHCVNDQCTCTTAASGDGDCVRADDCQGRCDHGRQHHCIDGRCRCTHF